MAAESFSLLKFAPVSNLVALNFGNERLLASVLQLAQLLADESDYYQVRRDTEEKEDVFH